MPTSRRCCGSEAGPSGNALQVRNFWPQLRLLPLALDAPRLVEALQWHRFRDLDLGSQWLRDKIIGHAEGLPGVEELMG